MASAAAATAAAAAAAAAAPATQWEELLVARYADLKDHQDRVASGALARTGAAMPPPRRPSDGALAGARAAAVRAKPAAAAAAPALAASGQKLPSRSAAVRAARLQAAGVVGAQAGDGGGAGAARLARPGLVSAPQSSRDRARLALRVRMLQGASGGEGDEQTAATTTGETAAAAAAATAAAGAPDESGFADEAPRFGDEGGPGAAMGAGAAAGVGDDGLASPRARIAAPDAWALQEALAGGFSPSPEPAGGAPADGGAQGREAGAPSTTMLPPPPMAAPLPPPLPYPPPPPAPLLPPPPMPRQGTVTQGALKFDDDNSDSDL